MRDDTYIDAVIIGTGVIFVGGIAAAAWAGRQRNTDVDAAHLDAFWDKWLKKPEPAPGATSQITPSARSVAGPEKDDAMRERIAAWRMSGVLDGWLPADAAVAAERRRGGRAYHAPDVEDALVEVNEINDRLRDEIKRFERAVWFAGLQRAVEESNARSLEATFGDKRALTYTMAGRTAITLEPVDESFSFQLIVATDATKPTMGASFVSSSNVTERRATSIMRQLADAFRHDPSMFKPAR